MGKLLDYIAKETQGECFASFKYCYDNMLPPNIEYEAKEDSYINMKEFAESIHDPHMRDMCPLAEKMRSMPPLFKGDVFYGRSACKGQRGERAPRSMGRKVFANTAYIG